MARELSALCRNPSYWLMLVRVIRDTGKGNKRSVRGLTPSPNAPSPADLKPFSPPPCPFQVCYSIGIGMVGGLFSTLGTVYSKPGG
jgi:hypothetical protein